MVKLTMSKKQSKFREEYKNSIAPWYSGWAHLLSIFIPGLLVIGFCLTQIHAPSMWEISILVPLFLFFNFSEWWLHKNTMHRPVKVLKGFLLPVYDRHTHQHHQYFSARRMSYDTNREWRIVLFPPYALLIFMTLTLPGALAIGYFGTANMGFLLMMLTPIYYLNYEIFHLCCHVRENWFVRNCPLINTIRRHHASHHSQQIMMEKNMNLTYPIADWFMGTSDLNCGLLGHLFNGYSTKKLKKEYASNQGSELDAVSV